MGRKLQISIVLVVLVAISGAFLIYLWDQAYDDEISEGVTIGGVDVGGLDADAAAAQIRANLVTPLDKDVVVRYGEEKYKLDANELEVSTDVNRMVDEALDASQDGGILGRTWRRLSGEELDLQIEPKIKYDEGSVNDFIAGVEENIDQEPQDASVEPTPTSLEPVPAKPGISVDADKLRKTVEGALQSPTDRKVKADVEKVKPEVTTGDLATQYPTYIVVDRANFELRLYKDLKLEKTYTVAIGAVGYDTPTGLYTIQDKQVDPVWNVPDSEWAGDLAGTTVPPGPENPLKARWMGIYNGAGIHGTEDIGSLGSAASHGCVRMAVPDVIDLYDRVDVGTPIYIS
jgi:lipoprotein-anchoring transpeptidase ErfK/SrfK